MISREPAKDEKTQIYRALNKWGVFEYFSYRPLIIQKIDKIKLVCVVTYALQEVVTYYRSV